jgi:hypothetical protein
VNAHPGKLPGQSATKALNLVTPPAKQVYNKDMERTTPPVSIIGSDLVAANFSFILLGALFITRV